MDAESLNRGADNMSKYVDAMAEIKRRIDVINTFLSGQRNAGYRASNVETIGLQFRKVFELIAFASLTAHKELYSAAHSDFAKHWQAPSL